MFFCAGDLENGSDDVGLGNISRVTPANWMKQGPEVADWESVNLAAILQPLTSTVGPPEYDTVLLPAFPGRISCHTWALAFDSDFMRVGQRGGQGVGLEIGAGQASRVF
jgi:hypothetical protein